MFRGCFDTFVASIRIRQPGPLIALEVIEFLFQRVLDLARKRFPVIGREGGFEIEHRLDVLDRVDPADVSTGVAHPPKNR